MVAASVGVMKAGIPSLAAVRDTHPSELAVLLSSVPVDEVFALSAQEVEALVVVTQKVASWSHAIQAMAVDRFADLTTDAMEVHVADRAAARDAGAGADASGRGERVVPVPEPDAIAASSLAPLLNIAPRTMRTRLNRARLLMELPRTLDLALAGQLEPWRVDGVVVAAQDVAWERLEEFEARLHDVDVSRLPKPRLVERARRAAVKADPDGVDRAHQVAPRRRGLRWGPSEVPGLMRWSADLPDDRSRVLAAAVDALAQEYLTADGHTGAHRSVEAARVDALVDLALASARVETLVEVVLPASVATPATIVTRSAQYDVIREALARHPLRADRARGAVPSGASGPGDDHGPPSAGAPPPVVDLATTDPVLVDLVAGRVTHHTLAAGGLERATALALGGHLERTGNPFLSLTPPSPPPPLPPPAGRAGARGESRVWFVDGIVEVRGTSGLLPAQVVAILQDPDTRVRVSGSDPGTANGATARRRTYRPGAALAARVRARDLHCRFPGCSVPAARCQLDHVAPFPAGESVEENLQSLCAGHHGFKHHAGWSVRMEPDGTCHWTSPTGRTHLTVPGSRRELAA